MQMKHFASCVGVNNVECEPQEKEHEVVPFSCASRGNVDMLGTSRLLVGGGGVKMFPCYGCFTIYYEAVKPEHSVAKCARYGSRHLLLLLNLLVVSHC